MDQSRSGQTQACPPPNPQVSIGVGSATTSGACAAGDGMAYDPTGCYFVSVNMVDFSAGSHAVRCYMTTNANHWQEFASYSAGNGVSQACSFSSAGRWVAVIVDGTLSTAYAGADQCGFLRNESNHTGTRSDRSQQWPTY